METIFWYVVGLIVLILLLIYGIYLPICLFSFLYRKFISHKKVPTGKQEIWFYNLWLPLIILGIGEFVFFLYGWYKETHDGPPIIIDAVNSAIALASPLSLALHFPIFYLIYHLFYWYITWAFSFKYYGGKLSLGIFIIFALISYFIHYNILG